MIFNSQKISVLYGFLFFSIAFFAQQKERFIRLEHQLNNHEYQLVPAVQDSLGYLWISNVNGINRFDGFGFSYVPFEEIFGRKRKNDAIEQLVLTQSGHLMILSENGALALKNSDGSFTNLSGEGQPFQGYGITEMLVDSGLIWMVTDKGELLSYDQLNKKLVTHITIPDFDFPRKKIVALAKSRMGILFMISISGDLFSFDTDSYSLEQIKIDLKDNFIYFADIAMDKEDRLWICTTSQELGLMIFDPRKKSFIQEELLSREILEDAKATFYHIICDSNGNIWMTSDGDGLYSIDLEANALKNYRFDVYDNNSLSSNMIMDIFEDGQQNLWLFTAYGQINVLPIGQTQTNVHSHRGAVNESSVIIQSTLKAKDGSLWVGTDGRGLLKIASDGRTKEQFLVNEDFSKGFLIEYIMEDQNGTIWISTVDDGIWHFNPKNKEANRFPVVNTEGQDAYIGLYLYEDKKNRIWASTDWGIAVYDSNYSLLTRFTNDDLGEEAYCKAMVETEDGKMWLGFENGLRLFNEHPDDLGKSTFTRIPFYDGAKADDLDLNIRKLTSDGGSKLWMTNNADQLFGFDYDSKSYFSFNYHLGNERPVFKSVEVQDSTNIWVSSNHGLWHLDLDSGKQERYFKSDGFLDSRFLKSSHKDEEGRLYFSSTSGINYFDPKLLSKSESEAELHLEGIKILNKQALTIVPEQISQGIPNVTRLDLKNTQSSFSFKFQAIDDLLSPEYNYSYQLKGFDDTWSIADNSRIATYTNIPSGDYEFVIRAGTGGNLWDIGQKSILIHIEKPLYSQWWAIALYILGSALIVIASVRWLLLKRNLALEKLRHQSDTEIYNARIDFFTKISHEIQTPLTLILLPLEELLKDSLVMANKRVSDRLKAVTFNAKRLSRLVFDLTTIRNKELEKQKLSISDYDLVADLKSIIASFQPMAKRKSISLRFETVLKDAHLAYDRTKIEHVLYNLLSNALKYTPEGGSITVHLSGDKSSDRIKITVQDTGIGIPQEELAHIFELFYQVSGEYKEGMGVGLALTKELVELHGGTIEVRSDAGIGTCFMIDLPSTRQKGSVTGTILEEGMVGPYLTSAKLVADQTSPIASAHPEWTVLVVEDDAELRELIASELGNYYAVLVAKNGAQGYALAKKHLPKLVLSDVMMPVLDGIALSRKLQRNKSTAHIPIVLLTADSSGLSKITALRTGVIEYLQKPFSKNELLLKVHNIIDQTHKIAQKTRADMIGTPAAADIKSKEQLLLEKVVAIIEGNMDNPGFKVESIASELHMSYSSLFKKFQSFTGQTMVDFVRSIRMKRAAELLSEGNYSVVDAADAVGFMDVKYFSKCFKRVYGKSPSDFKNSINSITGPEPKVP